MERGRESCVPATPIGVSGRKSQPSSQLRATSNPGPSGPAKFTSLLLSTGQCQVYQVDACLRFGTSRLKSIQRGRNHVRAVYYPCTA